MATVYKSKKEAVRLLMKDQGEFGNSPQEMKFTVDYLSFFGYLSLYLLNNLTLEDLKASRIPRVTPDYRDIAKS